MDKQLLRWYRRQEGKPEPNLKRYGSNPLNVPVTDKTLLERTRQERLSKINNDEIVVLMKKIGYYND